MLGMWIQALIGQERPNVKLEMKNLNRSMKIEYLVMVKSKQAIDVIKFELERAIL